MISAIVHTKNSAKTLKRALTSIMWADEIIVIDMGSQDETLAIAKKFKAKIYNHEDVGFVEPARNYGIKKAKGEWIIILDSDEEIPKALASKFRELENNSENVVAYAIARQNIVFGQKLLSGGWWPDYNIRFFRKGSVTWPEKIHSQPEIEGTTSHLEADEALAIHHHHYQTVEDYISRLNKYTTIEAEDHPKSEHKNSIHIFFDDFFRRYYQQKGYKDGEIGMLLSLFQANYQITTEAKRKIKSGFNNHTSSDFAVNKIIRDWKYWHATYQIDIHNNPILKIIWKIRRWLRI